MSLAISIHANRSDEGQMVLQDVLCHRKFTLQVHSPHILQYQNLIICSFHAFTLSDRKMKKDCSLQLTTKLKN